jgi:glyoxylase-like metal-dependent hydrolase (beta-lactamase superfamily II)
MHWTIGDGSITPITETETKTSPRFLFADTDRAAVLAIAEDSPWLRPHFVDEGGYLLQKVQCLVIDVGGARIAVDTCIGNDKTRSYAGWDHLQLPFLERMAEGGYPPESITHVVCTHLHVDHVGWNTRLIDGRWVPTFPAARYLFVEREYDHWRDTPNDDGGSFADSVAPIVDAGLAELVAADHRVNDCVRLHPTPGHTPGHAAVVVSSGVEQAVITGDLMHTPIQIARVELSSSFDSDPVEARATRRTFLETFSDGTLVIGTHFGTPSAGLVHADGNGGWRLEPVFAQESGSGGGFLHKQEGT